ncbi:hypothetical protein AU193_22310 [Mycobacterium sp. GA-1285]|uniref:hypothetical protein n=1 Tax=Mycobacterium sp. GA-1285 TaxID=1772282 RepID=UPI0007462E6E|nr:hypothetical protein [Mycobacterium sp. GA-1285]KUI16921.1 hypothetical protein AU193_22310 [Mycobacterium sp. GA-1285]
MKRRRNPLAYHLKEIGEFTRRPRLRICANIVHYLIAAVVLIGHLAHFPPLITGGLFLLELAIVVCLFFGKNDPATQSTVGQVFRFVHRVTDWATLGLATALHFGDLSEHTAEKLTVVLLGMLAIKILGTTYRLIRTFM